MGADRLNGFLKYPPKKKNLHPPLVRVGHIHDIFKVESAARPWNTKVSPPSFEGTCFS